MKTIIRIFIAYTSLIFINTAYAGISEYNAAMAAGDYPEAAKQAVDAWKSIDQTKASSPAVARDFAFVNYLVGDYKVAQIFTEDLVNKRGSLAKNDDQPLISNVLAELVNFSIKDNRRNASALLEALRERVNDPSVDRVSQIAAQQLLINDWQQGRYAGVARSSEVVIELYKRIGETAVVEIYQAEYLAAVSEFMKDREAKSYPKLVALHNAIFDTALQSDDDALVSRLSSLKWLAEAWAHALYSYSTSILDDNHNLTEPLKISGREKFIAFPDAYKNDLRPLCNIDPDSFSIVNLRFPAAASFSNMVGAVIIKYDVNPDGTASNAGILAVVPDEVFAKAVLDALPSIKLKASDGQSECRLERSNLIYTVRFTIQ